MGEALDIDDGNDNANNYDDNNDNASNNDNDSDNDNAKIMIMIEVTMAVVMRAITKTQMIMMRVIMKAITITQRVNDNINDNKFPFFYPIIHNSKGETNKRTISGKT